jgi:hypothetical protein
MRRSHVRWATVVMLLVCGLSFCRAAEKPTNEPPFKYDAFKKLVATGKPVFVEFWAPW